MSNTREKILLLLLGGLAFGCSYTSRNQWRILRTVSREWKKLDQKELREGITYLYRLGVLDREENSDGIFKVSLTEKGKLKALNCRLNSIKNKEIKWDKKWRMVSFDVPQKFKKERDVLRRKLKKIGFCELQKSVFITPFDCKEEIEDLVKRFELDEYVRFGILEYIDREGYFRKFFKVN
ncbi:MAG: hypothetical protein NT155_01060 [Candidatus Staskawiczbacteria bacterium]|nr:hypothetical protein [Candidatus Staskawiczbacteria bacterium]